jgi:tetratricopeptide (TPR) repeat protein
MLFKIMENQKTPIEFNKQKEQANYFFAECKYNDAITIYSQLLEWEPENYMILANRSAAYIKLKKWNEALNDAVTSTKLKPDWGKAWGRLGAALYGLDKLDEALVAYNKANELEPSNIYVEMIEEIKLNIINIKNNLFSNESKTQDPTMENLFSTMFDSVISNPKIMEKLTNPEFQSKVLTMQSNPLEALKDKEVMNIMSEMMKNLNTN